MTDLTDEAVKALLEGATPGPWRADGEPWNRVVWSSADNRVCFMAHSSGLNDDRDIATSNLIAAAPDLARTVIALHAQLADAKAAQALVVERCAEVVPQGWCEPETANTIMDVELGMAIQAVIRRLAPIDGLALVQELRAEIPRFPDHMAMIVAAKNADLPERVAVLVAALLKIPDHIKQYQWKADEKQAFGSKWVRSIAGDNGRGMGRQAIAEVVSHLEVADFIAAANPDTISLLLTERDRLAAANAVLEAKVAGLGNQTFYIDCEFDGHNGPLLSIAVVREDGWSLHVSTGAVAQDPWVVANVLPIMDSHNADVAKTVRPNEVGTELRDFIGDHSNPVIVADSPVDIGRFCRAISTGDDGEWSSSLHPGMTFIVRNVDCYPTALDGAVQHNAWWDAMALRAALATQEAGNA